MRFFVPMILSAPLLLVGCAEPQPLYVDGASISVAANADSPSAGYFTVHGGPEAVQLRAVTMDVAHRVEMHESVMDKGMMTMRPMEQVDIPAKSSVTFAPGGRHVMIFGLNPAVAKAGKADMTLIFSNGDRLIVTAAVRAQGAAIPAKDTAGGHEGH